MTAGFEKIYLRVISIKLNILILKYGVLLSTLAIQQTRSERTASILLTGAS